MGTIAARSIGMALLASGAMLTPGPAFAADAPGLKDQRHALVLYALRL